MGLESALLNGAVVSGVFCGVGAIDPGPPAAVIGTEEEEELILALILSPMEVDRGRVKVQEYTTTCCREMSYCVRIIYCQLELWIQIYVPESSTRGSDLPSNDSLPKPL